MLAIDNSQFFLSDVLINCIPYPYGLCPSDLENFNCDKGSPDGDQHMVSLRCQVSLYID